MRLGTGRIGERTPWSRIGFFMDTAGFSGWARIVGGPSVRIDESRLIDALLRQRQWHVSAPADITPQSITRAAEINRMSNIESVLVENRVFPPSEATQKAARISGMEAYNALCQEAERDFEGFWAR